MTCRQPSSICSHSRVFWWRECFGMCSNLARFSSRIACDMLSPVRRWLAKARLRRCHAFVGQGKYVLNDPTVPASARSCTEYLAMPCNLAVLPVHVLDVPRPFSIGPGSVKRFIRRFDFTGFFSNGFAQCQVVISVGVGHFCTRGSERAVLDSRFSYPIWILCVVIGATCMARL